MKIQDKKGLRKVSTGYKYNWTKMKSEYLQCKYPNVRDFLKAEYGITLGSNSAARANTRWWEKDRQEMIAKSTQQAKDAFLRKHSLSVEQMIDAKFELIDKMIKLGRTAKDAREVKVVVDQLKVEMNEPTAYIKQDNSGTLIFKNYENLTPEEREKALLEELGQVIDGTQ